MLTRIYSPYASFAGGQTPAAEDALNQQTPRKKQNPFDTKDAPGKPANSSASALLKTGTPVANVTNEGRAENSPVRSGLFTAVPSASWATQPVVNQQAALQQAGLKASGGAVAGSSVTAESLAAESPLQTIALHQQQQPLTGKAVFTDMRQTASLLGASEGVMADVNRYVQLAEQEGEREEPNEGLIHNMLYLASDALDTHVSTALGSPSKVVREWVEALTSQPVEWKKQTASAQRVAFKPGAASTTPSTASPVVSEPPATTTLQGVQEGGEPITLQASAQVSASATASPATLNPSTLNPSTLNPSTLNPSTLNPSTLNPADGLRLQGLMDQFQTASSEKNWPQAQRVLDRALAVASNSPNHPITGRLNWLKAKTYGQQGQWQQALSHAAKVQETLPLNPQQQARLNALQGEWLQQLNQPQQAQAVLQQGLAALQANPASPPALQQALSMQLAKVHTQQGQWQHTLDLLKTLPPSAEQQALQAQAYWKLGQAQPAEASFRASLQQARQGNSRTVYTETLRQTAAFYLDQGRVSKAQGLLSVLQQLGV